MVVNEVRRYMEAAIGRLSPKRARELAASLMEGARKEQVSKAAQDLVKWSTRNRQRLTELVRVEVRSQLKQLGLASRDEVDALRKRVRDLERGRSGSKKAAAEKAGGAKRSSVKQPGAAAGSTATSRSGR